MLDEIAYGSMGETFCMSECSTETQESAACSQADDASGMKMVKNSQGGEIGEGNCCVDARLEISTVRMEDFLEKCRLVNFLLEPACGPDWSGVRKTSSMSSSVGTSGHAANWEMELSGVEYVIGIDNSWLFSKK
eukprot:CAMPEP_0194305090 /NCGR_PEP_ID=MMETSP0171-20130528/2608_1 /TAXON_ID=218684 /ORGANISM="Corethron pennatum, Strain L29A3" /LENGTH=133 /DNA_ID=CAMNT_0039056511 /DNA_START=453 /DNA_END=855 /DNA_ORIENTATION=+